MEFHSGKHIDLCDQNSIDDRYMSHNSINHHSPYLTSPRSSDTKGFGFSSMLQQSTKHERDREKP